MAFARITEKDLENRGVIGLPDTPGLSTAEMQEKFEETARQVIVPAFNRLVEALTRAEGESGAQNIGAFGRDGLPTNVQAHILSRENPHGLTAASVGAATVEQVKQLIAEARFQSGSADMYRKVYDPRGLATDIFAYVDRAVSESISAALNEGV